MGRTSIDPNPSASSIKEIGPGISRRFNVAKT